MASYATSYAGGSPGSGKQTFARMASWGISDPKRSNNAYEHFASADNPRLQRRMGENGEYEKNSWLDAVDPIRPYSGQDNAKYDSTGGGYGFTETDRETAFERDRRDPLYVAAAQELGVNLNSANDMGQVVDYIARGRGKSEDSSAKNKQALDMSQAWRQQSGSTTGGDSGSGDPAQGSGSYAGPGLISYQDSLEGDSYQRNGLYDQVAMRGDAMTQEFRDIGAQYRNLGMQGADEIGRAAWDAVESISPKALRTFQRRGDYINPYKTPVGPGDKTLAQMTQRALDIS